MTESESRYFSSAEIEYAAIFEQLDSIVEQLHNWFHADNIPAAPTAIANVKLAFYIRALNQYRSILNLLRTNHWEDGLILTRSLFELVLNAEELFERQQDQEAAAMDFLAFSELQELREWLSLERYLVTSKRAPESRGKELDHMESFARKLFAKFSYKDKKGRERWRDHWTNKNVADLCHLSRNKMRIHHYRLLYAKGSTFTHSSPRVVVAAMYRGEGTWKDFINFSNHQEEKGLRLVASFATMFLVDIVKFTGDRLPNYSEEWLFTHALPIAREVGAPTAK